MGEDALPLTWTGQRYELVGSASQVFSGGSLAQEVCAAHYGQFNALPLGPDFQVLLLHSWSQIFQRAQQPTCTRHAEAL